MSHYFEGFPGNTLLNLQSPLWGVPRLWMETLKNSKRFPAASNCKTSPLSWPFHCHKGPAMVKSMAFLGLFFFIALCQLTLLTICPPPIPRNYFFCCLLWCSIGTSSAQGTTASSPQSWLCHLQVITSPLWNALSLSIQWKTWTRRSWMVLLTLNLYGPRSSFLFLVFVLFCFWCHVCLFHPLLAWSSFWTCPWLISSTPNECFQITSFDGSFKC